MPGTRTGVATTVPILTALWVGALAGQCAVGVLALAEDVIVVLLPLVFGAASNERLGILGGLSVRLG